MSMIRSMYCHPDLHMHSVFSDGSDTPEQLLNHVRAAGVDLFALTDHDTFDGCRAVRDLLQTGDPAFVTGVELSCEADHKKYHILGYDFDESARSIMEAVGITHQARREKTQNRIQYLKDVWGMGFSEEDLAELIALENPGRPHFALLMLKYGYVKEKDEAFSILARYHGSERKLRPEEAIHAILESGGIPVLAHAPRGDGSSRLSAEEVRERVVCLRAMGLRGVECYYSVFTEEEQQLMLALADEQDLLVTAGSDYHGSNKPVHIGQTNHPDSIRMEAFFQKIRKSSELRR